MEYNMKKVLFAVVAALGLTACEETVVAPAPFVPAVTTVSLNVTAAQIEVGRTVNITATVKDQRDSVMTGKVVTWSSSNTPVATVANGVVTGVTKGQATIVASVDGKVATATVFVADASVNSVSLVATVPSPFFVGQTVQASATPRDVNNNPLSTFAVTWSSSNPSVATVSPLGLITAVSAGSTTITATSSGKTASVVVNTSLVPVSTVTLSATKPAQIGRTIQLSSLLKSSTGTTLTTDQRVLGWASTDTTVATVSSTGVLTGVSAGTTVVTCVVEGKVGLLNVNVSEVGIQYIVVAPDSADVKVGATRQFTAQAFDSDSVSLSVGALNGRKFVWTSSDATKGVVSAGGLVTGVSVGAIDITATIGTVSKSAKAVIVP
jgi:uncharacterized protein YjdB